MRESLFYDMSDNTEWMGRVAKAWRSIHLKGKTYFRKKDYVVYSPYVKWIEQRNKDRHWPFSLEAPLYPQEPDQPDDAPKGSYDHIQAQNLRLLAKNEELGMKLLMASQGKAQLSHKLKKVQREMNGVVKAKKRPRFKDGRGSTSISVEVHEKILKEVEEKIKQKRRIP